MFFPSSFRRKTSAGGGGGGGKENIVAGLGVSTYIYIYRYTVGAATGGCVVY